MTSNYYDVVVIGMELGPLTAGALLARRGFRVLVVGQSGARDRYDCLGYTFTHRPFLLTSAGSPVVKRIIEELTLGQLFQQVVQVPRPFFQVVLPDARLDVFENHRETLASIDRELAADPQQAADLLEWIGTVNGEIDKLLAGDLVVPPETFFERREYARAEVQDPFFQGRRPDLLGHLAADHPLGRFLNTPIRMETAGADATSPLLRARQAGGWLFGCLEVQGGRDGLRRLLCDRIVGQGGDVHPDQSVSELITAKGRVTGVGMSGREEPTGCRTVLTDLSPAELAPLISSDQWPGRFRTMVEDAPEPVLGYTINLGVLSEVVPAGLGHTAFARFGDGLGDELIRVEVLPQRDETRCALNVSCIVPPGGEAGIGSGALRDALLDRVRWLVPFLDNHLEVLHSPFDTFGPVDLTGGRLTGPAPSIPHPEEVPRWLLRPPPKSGPLGVERLPHRTGIKGLILAGGQVVSGLSTEGELLAAWGAARIAGKMDPGRRRVVMSMRSKVEI